MSDKPATQTTSGAISISQVKASEIIKRVDELLREDKETIADVIHKCLHAKTWKAMGGKKNKKIDDYTAMLAAARLYRDLCLDAVKADKKLPGGAKLTQVNYYGEFGTTRPPVPDDGSAGAGQAEPIDGETQ